MAEQDGRFEAGVSGLFGQSHQEYVTWNGYAVTSPPKRSPRSGANTASYRCRVRYRGFDGEPCVASVSGGLATFEYFGETQGYTYFKYFADPPDTVYLRIPQRGKGVMEFGYTYVSETRKVPPGPPKRPGAAFEATNTTTETTVTLTPIGVAEFGRESPGTGTWNPLRSHTVVYPGNPPPLCFGGSFAPDDWHGIGRYALTFEDIKLRGDLCDLSSLTTRHPAGAGNVWVEGTTNGSIGLWGVSLGKGVVLSVRSLLRREGPSSDPSRRLE
ncbi:MAG: hypothetical protein ABFD94_18830 [Armatimonadia bacterium]